MHVEAVLSQFTKDVTSCNENIERRKAVVVF